MRSDIAYLEIVEKDLAELAAKAKTRAAEGSGRRGLLGRGRMPVAAAVVALLVAAGGIGFLAQGGRKNSSPASGGAAVAAASPAARDALHQAQLGAPFTNKVITFAPNARGQVNPTSDSGSAGGSDAGAPPADTSLQGVGIGDLSKIERDGSISLQIPNGTFSTKMAEVIKVTTANGGSVLSSTTAAEKSGTFTLRVPARNFENAMIALRPLGTVLSSQEVGKDVTAQYVDLKAHMRILFGRRAVILKLMSHATTISDTLVLQNQYDNTQLQIDQYQGQLNVIHNQVAESTITVSLAEKDSPSKVAATTVSTPSVGRSFHLGWQGFLRVIGAVVIGLGYLIPIAVLFAIAWTVRVLARRRRVASSAI